MKMEQTECSETSAYKIQTPGNYPKENIQRTEHDESLKLRIQLRILVIFPRAARIRNDRASRSASSRQCACTFYSSRGGFFWQVITRPFRGKTKSGFCACAIESRWRRDFPHLSRPALRLTQPPVQWAPGLSRRYVAAGA